VQLAIFHAEMGHTEDAFASLADAAVKGFSDVERLRSEPKLAALRSDERWQQVELFVDVNGAQGSLPDQSAHPPEPVQAQRPMPPSAKVNIAAPDWSLTDAAGNVVRLSDLRGKVVIMDFWATWCGPCKRSMPEIDKFTRKYAGQNLAVFSVNVWDRSADVVLEWWREQDYSMQLLFGSRELTTAYEVQGIPHLCVIDGEGIIRYSQAGFHPQLLDYLVKWTESARKDG
jgi:thiol-disulfide isomerase/thioredoxin